MSQIDATFDFTSDVTPPPRRSRRRALPPVRVAIAHDAAFRFCYADLPAVLQELGADVSFFSPMRDAAPPPCDALYFPGGYPELYARELSANTAMPGALRQLAQRGVPMYGECGGFIYMMRDLVDHDGTRWPMAGLLPLSCRMGTRWAALGYRCCEGRFRGHEFHYGQIENSPTGQAPLCPSLWQSVKDGSGNELGPQGCCRGSVCGSWIHLAPEGARPFWRAWLDLARAGRATPHGHITATGTEQA